jgi:AbrB family looped-hinge helix DNA binding protein
MTTVLSSKGQVVLPQAARRRLGLLPGTAFECRIQGNQIVLIPQAGTVGAPRLVRDPLTGIMVTQGPQGTPPVTSERIRELLSDFP